MCFDSVSNILIKWRGMFNGAILVQAVGVYFNLRLALDTQKNMRRAFLNTFDGIEAEGKESNQVTNTGQHTEIKWWGKVSFADQMGLIFIYLETLLDVLTILFIVYIKLQKLPFINRYEMYNKWIFGQAMIMALVGFSGLFGGVLKNLKYLSSSC